MKRCPQCGREYDNTMMFCLDDGAELLYGPARSEPGAIATGFRSDEPQTAIMHSTAASGEAPTRAQIDTTEQTAVLPSGIREPVKNGLDKRLLAAPFLVAIIALGGLFGYRYFTASDAGQINSIAVLPFENRSGDADTDYLSDGLADSLIYRLSQLPNLKVSPTSSVMRYKGKETDVATIAKELEVDAVMSGRLSQRGDDLSISVQLIDAGTKKLIWAEQYDRKMADLLATQREIATAITQKLELKLSGNETGITKKYTDNNEAYQLYLRGRHSFAKRTKEDMLRAIEFFKQAVKLDPKFALAYARLSEVYGTMPAYPYLSPREAFPEAKAAAEKALEIDPTLSEAHTFLAYAQVIYDWNWAEGERSFKRALELDPNNFSAHFRYGQIYLLSTGRIDEGISEIKQGLKAEPLDVNMGVTVAWADLIRGQNEKAFEVARKIHDLEPNHLLSRWMLASVLTEMRRHDEAIAICEKWLQDEPNSQMAIRDAGFAYAKAGRRDKAEEMIARYRELAKTEWVAAARIASIYGALGEKDKAFAELEKALEARDWEMHRLNVELYMRPLRDDPRFKAILKRLNLPE
ncbi:MAG: tetratricopeptide repeat protein [Acidobacteria bacterium]|nr:tetratricopeptide repeat protein [Acidobacteriota bacterium]